jgi:hypothetical protein
MPKFERFWICCKRERAIFLRRPKTYGSSFIHIERESCRFTFKKILNDQFYVLYLCIRTVSDFLLLLCHYTEHTYVEGCAISVNCSPTTHTDVHWYTSYTDIGFTETVATLIGVHCSTDAHYNTNVQ